jgi:maltose O-acetyltransferase
MRSEKDKMLAGELYDASAPDTQADLAATPRWLARYNTALDMPPSERRKILVERFASSQTSASDQVPALANRKSAAGSLWLATGSQARHSSTTLGSSSGTARPAENASPGRAALGNLQRRWCDLVAACPIVPVSSEMMDER